MAYFAGWVFQKETKWADDVNDHILLCHQVRHTNKHSTLHLNMLFLWSVSCKLLKYTNQKLCLGCQCKNMVIFKFYQHL